MQQPKLSTVVAFLAVAVLLGTTVDALLNLGDTFKGEILVMDEDIVEFEGLAGERVNVSVKADKKQGLLPHISITAPDMSVVIDEGSGKKKTSLKKVDLPATGIYQIHVTGDQATIGTYTMKTGGKLSKDITKVDNGAAVGNGETQSTMFDAKSGFLLNGTISVKNKSDAVAFNPTITGPSSEGNPLELTGFIEKNKKGVFKIKDLPLPLLGSYVFSVDNSGLSGVITTKLKLKKPKVKKQTILEEND